MNKELEKFISDTMVYVPKGTEQLRKFNDENKWISSSYRMSIPSKGTNQSQSVDEVIISAFYMSRFVVTNKLYSLITGTQNSSNASELTPKVNISWIDAIKFCNTLSSHFGLNSCYLIQNETEVSYKKDANGFRLATEVEWQYACKANSNSYQYSDIETIAWHSGNSDNKVHNVGMKNPNAFGLHDMLGNVWEWCWDLFNPETYDSYRIFRGGSFAEESRICGATTRRKSLPTFEIDDLGFRIVKST